MLSAWVRRRFSSSAIAWSKKTKPACFEFTIGCDGAFVVTGSWIPFALEELRRIDVSIIQNHCERNSNSSSCGYSRDRRRRRRDRDEGLLGRIERRSAGELQRGFAAHRFSAP